MEEIPDDVGSTVEEAPETEPEEMPEGVEIPVQENPEAVPETVRQMLRIRSAMRFPAPRAAVRKAGRR